MRQGGENSRLLQDKCRGGGSFRMGSPERRVGRLGLREGKSKMQPFCVKLRLSWVTGSNLEAN